jgi:hypothetical protein
MEVSKTKKKKKGVLFTRQRNYTVYTFRELIAMIVFCHDVEG